MACNCGNKNKITKRNTSGNSANQRFIKKLMEERAKLKAKQNLKKKVTD